MKMKYIYAVLSVLFAGISYGVLATLVELAYKEGYSTAEITFAQVSIGLFAMFIINYLLKSKNGNTKVSKSEATKLIIVGTSFGLTSVFYYLAVKSGIPIALCIILLMQSVWIGAVADFIINKEKPTLIKIVGIILTLTGTLLASNILKESSANINTSGVIFGILASLSYTTSITASNKVGRNLAPAKKSLYFMIGAFIIVLICIGVDLLATNSHIITLANEKRASNLSLLNWNVFTKWGIIIALFGTILPPLLLSKGMPTVGIGLGCILTSIELPVSITCAFILLGQTINNTQLLGVILILSSIVLMNLSLLKKK